MSELWGVPSGLIAAQEQQQSKALFGLQMAEGQMTLQEGDLAIQKGKLALETQRRMLQAMSSIDRQGKPDASQSADVAADQLQRYAMAIMPVAPVESGKLLTQAASVRAHDAYITNLSSKRQDRNFQEVQAAYDPATVVDDKTMAMAAQRVKLATGYDSPYAGYKYDATLVKVIHESAKTEGDKALTKLRIQEAKTSAANESLINYKRNDLLPEQVKWTQEKERLAIKGGAKALVPTATTLKAITDLAEQKLGPGMVDASTLRAASRSAAEHAQAMIADGKPASKAYQEAFDAAWRDEAYAGIALPAKSLGASRESPRAVPQGRPADPAKRSEWDKKNLKSNQWYIGNDGTLAVWDPEQGGFVVPPEPTAQNEGDENYPSWLDADLKDEEEPSA